MEPSFPAINGTAIRSPMVLAEVMLSRLRLYVTVHRIDRAYVSHAYVL